MNLLRTLFNFCFNLLWNLPTWRKCCISFGVLWRAATKAFPSTSLALMFLEVSLVARFQMCFIKTTLNNISILLLIDQIISASEKKKPITCIFTHFENICKNNCKISAIEFIFNLRAGFWTCGYTIKLHCRLPIGTFSNRICCYHVWVRAFAPSYVGSSF